MSIDQNAGKINEAEKPNDNVVNPIEFMNEEEKAADNVKAEAFIMALRFGTSNFFKKLKEVYEVEGIDGLYRMERSLDAYMAIRQVVIDEVITSDQVREQADIENDHKSLEIYHDEKTNDIEPVPVENTDLD